MAFEQYFYTGNLQILMRGESAHYQGERVFGGSLAGGTAHVEITPAISGGVVNGAAAIHQMSFYPQSGGGAINNAEVSQQVIFSPQADGGFGDRWINIGETDHIFSVLSIITELPDGGILGGGVASEEARYDPVATGGVIHGGHAFSDESRPVSGGIFVGGKAFVSEKDEEIGSGGILVGGENSWEGHVGGTLGGGSATIALGGVGEGGIVSGGVASRNVIYTIPVSGGVVINGDSHNIENITPSGGALIGGSSEAAEDAFGGLLAGGRATTLYDEVASGGILCGGLAPNGTHDFGSGGALIGGSVIQRITQHIDSSGVVLGGKPDESPAVSGGVVFGGVAVQTFDEAGVGGVILGGRARVEDTVPISGGILVGGRLVVGIEPGVFGGAILGGTKIISNNEFGLGGAILGGTAFNSQSAYHYVSDGDFVQVTQPDPNIYKITTKNFTYVPDEEGIVMGGDAIVDKRFFGQSIPKFSFGKPSVKNEACRSFREVIRQPTVLAMTRTQTREWLETLDADDWSITSFDPKKREVCILVDAGKGITHLVTAELLLVDSGVGSP
tara:strand:+ start:966 stop:2642 length:1677 start_codon:yes stop_codon:yes gene_type:complete